MDSGEIPPFRPAKGELPPTFWEQHGLLVILGLLALLALAGVLWRLIANRPSPTPPSPAETARAALASLLDAGSRSKRAADVPSANHSHEAPSHATSHPTHGTSPGSEIFPRDAGSTLDDATRLQAPPALADQVSSILRDYFVAALGLSIPQLTNRELANELQAHSKLTPELCQSASAFLLALDQFRFNPDLNTGVPTPVQTAMTLVDQTEAVLHPPESASTSVSTP